jgi:glutamyl/glutaminyl-tRNA synthetase
VENIINETMELVQGLDMSCDSDTVVNSLKTYSQSKKISHPKYMQLLRLSLTNLIDGPPIAELYTILRRDRFLDHLKNASKYASTNNGQQAQSANQ